MSVCDPEVYKNGKFLVLFVEGECAEMNEFAKHLSKIYKIKVDWYWMGGRARFLALTDDYEIIDAMRKYIYSIKKMTPIYYGEGFNVED